jgi:hypothetical protein
MIRGAGALLLVHGYATVCGLRRPYAAGCAEYVPKSVGAVIPLGFRAVVRRAGSLGP